MEPKNGGPDCNPGSKITELFLGGRQGRSNADMEESEEAFLPLLTRPVLARELVDYFLLGLGRIRVPGQRVDFCHVPVRTRIGIPQLIGAP